MRVVQSAYLLSEALRGRGSSSALLPVLSPPIAAKKHAKTKKEGGVAGVVGGDGAEGEEGEENKVGHIRPLLLSAFCLEADEDPAIRSPGRGGWIRCIRRRRG